MHRNTPPNPPASAGERRLARLVVPAPSAYRPHQRIDWIHDPYRQITPTRPSTRPTAGPVGPATQTRELGLLLGVDGCC